jgi:uncharacterized protein DUF6049
VLLCCASLTSLAGAQADPRRERAGRATISIALTEVAPKTVRPKNKIRVRGTLTNRSGQAITGVRYRLRFSSRRIGDRGTLARWAGLPVTSLPQAREARPLRDLGAADANVPWQLSVDAADLGLRSFGAYPVGVEFLNAAGQSLGGQVTFVSFLPSAGTWFKPVTVGWVWPLLDRMHRSDDDTFLDDQLATDLAPGGRLHDLVGAAADTKTPLTWMVDPALLADAERMTAENYTVQPPRQKAQRKETSPAAKDWLDKLRGAVGQEPYVALPYADVDADALVRNGMTRDLDAAVQATQPADRLLGRPATHKISWPVGGVAQNRTLNRLARRTDGFLLSSGAFQPADTRFTSDAPTTLQTSQGVKPVLMYDATLSEIVSGNTRVPGAAVLAEQRFLAETAMIAAELPTVAKTIVIAPDRRWNPDPALAKRLLTYTSAAAWMKAGRVDQLAGIKGAPALAYTGYPASYQAYELGSGYLQRVGEVRARANAFSAILSPVSYPFTHAILRTQSASWRGGGVTGRRATAARNELSAKVTGATERVRVLLNRAKTVQLAGQTGRIPLTIANGLTDRAIHVRLRITSKLPQKLAVGEYEADLKLNPRENRQVDFEVESFAQGPAEITVELLTPGGKKYRPAETVRVNTTGYGPLALLITGGALAVLFVGVGYRAMRARRRNTLEEAGDGSAESAPGEAPWTPGPGRP